VLADAPRLLLWTGLVAGGITVLLWLWIVRRIGRRLRGAPQRPIGFARYVVAFAVSLCCAACSAFALMATAALSGYRALAEHAKVAEVQCIELSPGKLRLYYVPIERGVRGATQTYDLDGDEWTVGGEVLRFHPQLVALGLRPYARVTRIEGRWSRAADANRHRPTAYDLHASSIGAWRWLQRNGARGPLHWLVAGVHGSAISQEPDRLAVFALMMTADGYVLDKRSL